MTRGSNAKVLGVCILSILAISWTAADIRSFTSLATAPLRPYGWHEIAYVAVKIKKPDISKLHNDVDILNYLSRATSDHPGLIYSPASLHLYFKGISG